MKAVFLDRDGVINEVVYHQEMGIIDSPFTVRQFQLIARVPEAIRSLRDLGLKVLVVSNQPGIAKKHFTSDVMDRMNRKLTSLLKKRHSEVDGVYYCLHHPEAKLARFRKKCDCRKPGIGLLLQAAAEWGVSLRDCYMVGDGITDMQAGRSAGCRTIFIGNWKCDICRIMEQEQVRPDAAAKNLWEATEIIRRWEGGLAPAAWTLTPRQEVSLGA